MRRLLCALAAAAMLVAGAAPASAAPTEKRPLVRGLPVYLALGDSVAVGVQSAQPTGDREATLALWKASGYAAQFADVLRDELDCLPAASPRAAGGCRQLQYVNAAVPGATTESFLTGQLPQATALLADRNQDRNPRNDVEVVTLTLGGNDVFRPVTSACLPDASSPVCLQAIRDALTGFAVNYTRILAELRAAAGPDTVIVTMTYYNPVDACYLGQAPYNAGPLGDLVLEGDAGLLAAGFNDIVRAVSGQYGAVVADAYGELDVPEDFVGGRDCLHPDASGHAALAEVFADALR